MKRTDFLYKIGELLCFAKERNIALICFTFHRTISEQYQEFLAGRSNCDGTIKKSQHQKWLAMDFVIVDGQGGLHLGEYPRIQDLGGVLGVARRNMGRALEYARHDPYHMELS